MLYMEGVKREFKLIPPPSQIGKVDILFRQIATLIKVRLAFIFGLQTLQSIDLCRIYCLKGLEPKNKGYFQIDGC